MKKLLAFFIVLGMCVGLLGCTEIGSSTPNNTETNSSQTTESTKATESKEVTKATEATKATETTAATKSTEATDGTTATSPVHTHNWQPATCSAPKTCTACGATSGLTAGHNFENGTCTSCGKTDPDYVQVTMVWIPTKGGTKYHSKENCSGMDNPDHVTQSQAEQLGFTPCKKCCK